jgi:hypothetical protein
MGAKRGGCGGSRTRHAAHAYVVAYPRRGGLAAAAAAPTNAMRSSERDGHSQRRPIVVASVLERNAPPIGRHCLRTHVCCAAAGEVVRPLIGMCVDAHSEISVPVEDGA